MQKKIHQSLNIDIKAYREEGIISSKFKQSTSMEVKGKKCTNDNNDPKDLNDDNDIA